MDSFAGFHDQGSSETRCDDIAESFDEMRRVNKIRDIERKRIQGCGPAFGGEHGVTHELRQSYPIIGFFMTEGRCVKTCPYAPLVGNDRDESSAGSENPPDLA